jgi:dTMP kinase
MKNTSMHPRTELLLFLSARAQLVEEVIRPRLAAGEIVISDRYADSTLAYQGYGHGVDRDVIRSLLAFATGGLKPDLTLLLDVDAETGLRRRQTGGGEWNRLDAYQLEFHRRVRDGYRELASLEPERWVIVDAEQTPEMVQLAIRGIVTARTGI